MRVSLVSLESASASSWMLPGASADSSWPASPSLTAGRGWRRRWTRPSLRFMLANVKATKNDRGTLVGYRSRESTQQSKGMESIKESTSTRLGLISIGVKPSSFHEDLVTSKSSQPSSWIASCDCFAGSAVVPCLACAGLSLSVSSLSVSLLLLPACWRACLLATPTTNAS